VSIWSRWIRFFGMRTGHELDPSCIMFLRQSWCWRHATKLVRNLPIYCTMISVNSIQQFRLSSNLLTLLCKSVCSNHIYGCGHCRSPALLYLLYDGLCFISFSSLTFSIDILHWHPPTRIPNATRPPSQPSSSFQPNTSSSYSQ
jgi:hypothetical protein